MPTPIQSESRRVDSARPQRLHSAALLVISFVAATELGCSPVSPAVDEDCSQTAPALDTCPGSAVVQGIDVSMYQGAIVWSRVKEAGIGFAFARISDGTTAPDPEFENNWTAMKEAGVVRGSYQYFRASEDVMGQVGLVVARLSDAGGLLAGDLPVVMDIETADNQSNTAVRQAMSAWLGAVAAATGRPPIIYTNSSMSSVLGSGFGDYALWVADWAQSCPATPNGWSTWRFWQYSDVGSVSGIGARVDLDEFDGPLSALMVFAGGDGDGGQSPGPTEAAVARQADAEKDMVDSVIDAADTQGERDTLNAGDAAAPTAGESIGPRDASTTSAARRCYP
jgi:lysozyme